jgi:putative phage-type endonuclease
VRAWALPEAQLVLPATAPREQWLTARRAGIGSSDIAQLMGVAEGGSEYELWLDKVGAREGEAERTEAMRRGTWLEPHVVDYFAERTKLRTRRCGLVRHRTNPIVLATPDRLTDDGGLLEVKTVGAHSKVAAQWRHGGIAAHAYVQLQWQLATTGRTHGWLAAYTIDEEPRIRGPVERDEPLIERMRIRAQRWWDIHVLQGTPPAPDLRTITDEEIALRWPEAEPGHIVQARWPAHVRALLAERAECHHQLTAAKKRKDEIDQALKVMIGDAEALVLGDRPVVTLKPRVTAPSVDPALEVDHPDIYRRYVRRGTPRTIHIVKGWETRHDRQ